jgi:hypothetical protein
MNIGAAKLQTTLSMGEKKCIWSCEHSIAYKKQINQNLFNFVNFLSISMEAKKLTQLQKDFVLPTVG